jgi:hypothetical protein
MGPLLQDIRYGFRGLARSPGFTAVALLSLAIGISANTAIFSIANTLLLRPLPYKDAGRLVILWNRSPGVGITEDWFSTAQYFDIKTGHHGFEDVAIAIGGNENLTGDGEPERAGTIHVSSNLLPMLGVEPAKGRLFVSSEDAKGSAGTAILGYGMWVRRYGSDPHVIGKSLTINGSTYQVIGILPRSFSLPREVLPTLGGAEQADILLPLPLAPRCAAKPGSRRLQHRRQAEDRCDATAGAGRDGHDYCSPAAGSSHELPPEWRPYVRHRSPVGTSSR